MTMQNPPDYRHDTVLPLPMEVTANAWAVDAACSGNPGPMEYQAIDLATGAQVFHFGPMHRRIPRHSTRSRPARQARHRGQDHLLRLAQRHPVGAEATVQDEARTHTTNRATLPDHSTRRDMAAHASDKKPCGEVGDEEVGRSACRLRTQGLRVILHKHT
jgi:hypothetical protein